MIDEIYIIKDNGICIASYPDDKEDEKSINEDLKSSMIFGVETGIKEAFKGRIKSINLNNGKKIYFSEQEIDGSPVRIVVLLDARFKKYGILGRMIKKCLRSIEEDGKTPYTLRSASIDRISCTLEEEVKEVQKKLKTIMNSFK